MIAAEVRTIHCPACRGAYAGDWDGVECRGCGDTRTPTDAASVGELLRPAEVIRFVRGGILAAAIPSRL